VSDDGDLTLSADFPTVDDLLSAAQDGTLTKSKKVTLLPAGRIGPLVEIHLASLLWPNLFDLVSINIPFARLVLAALEDGALSGAQFNSRMGVIPLRPGLNEGEEWIMWCHRAEQAAAAVGFTKGFAASVVGAMIELQENIYVHSQRPETGLVAYGASQGGFEIVVADRGIGVLASLQQNEAYHNIRDAGEALKIAVRDGTSRFGKDSGRGYGMGQMFRALANHDGELRFRSDDYALLVRGHSPTLTGTIELRQKACLPGLTISVRCPAPGRVHLN
jgi:anti-sigma regulatory factor (Ser/Thr protein kinase)